MPINGILIMTQEAEREKIKDETHQLHDEEQVELDEAEREKNNQKRELDSNLVILYSLKICGIY